MLFKGVKKTGQTCVTGGREKVIFDAGGREKVIPSLGAVNK